MPSTILKKNNIKSADAGSALYTPIQKYRWMHAPATFHQIDKVFYGIYTDDATQLPLRKTTGLPA